MTELPFQSDKQRHFVIIDERHTFSEEDLVHFLIKNGLIEAPKPKEHHRRIEHSKSTLNREQRRQLEKRNRRKRH